MGEVLLLVVLFAVGGLLQAAGKRRREQAESPLPRAGAPRQDGGGLLAELQKALEEMGHPGGAAGLEDEAEEEGVSLETEEATEVRSLEDLTPRPERVVVDQDEAIEAIAAKRVEWAEARARPHTKADHRAFDRKIRAVEPAVVAVPDRLVELRKMIIWQEVLGKPVALRDRD